MSGAIRARLQVDVNRISGGKGWCSKVYLITVESADRTQKLPQHVFKVPGSGALEEVDGSVGGAAGGENSGRLRTIKEMHNRECAFYELFADAAAVPISPLSIRGLFTDEPQSQGMCKGPH